MHIGKDKFLKNSIRSQGHDVAKTVDSMAVVSSPGSFLRLALAPEDRFEKTRYATRKAAFEQRIRRRTFSYRSHS